jgi:hypothetical protein
LPTDNVALLALLNEEFAAVTVPVTLKFPPVVPVALLLKTLPLIWPPDAVTPPVLLNPEVVETLPPVIANVDEFDTRAAVTAPPVVNEPELAMARMPPSPPGVALPRKVPLLITVPVFMRLFVTVSEPAA